MSKTLLQKIDAIFADASCISDQECRVLVDEFLHALEQGLLRCAYKSNEKWVVDERVKRGIMLAFRVGKKEKVSIGSLTFIDKDNLWPRRFEVSDGIRIVPGVSAVRRGAYLGRNVVVMPPAYVNIGAFVDEGTLVDSHVLVGSCAQVGMRVHISTGAQIGGVLEPVGASPVIVEDDVLIGGNCGIYEGTQIGARAVIGAGVILTKSTKVFDLVHEEILVASEHEVLAIPPDAVVVPGARQLSTNFAKKHGLSVASPLIIKYRDSKTATKTKREELLR
jgi:2,3,4,5-tetrahydropyridine-2-carboxylate N-succinyltransferase